MSSDASRSVSSEIWSTRAWILGETSRSGAAHRPRLGPAAPKNGLSCLPGVHTRVRPMPMRAHEGRGEHQLVLGDESSASG